MTQYIIARCRGSETLALAADLAARGLDAWTPRIKQRMRLPRKRKVVTLIRPAMPTFVFIAESDIDSSTELAVRWQVPQHRVFMFNGGPMAVDGMELLPLRRLDAEADGVRHNSQEPLLPIGTRVVVVVGPFSKMTGVVTSHSKEYLGVCLENSSVDIKMTPFFVKPLPL